MIDVELRYRAIAKDGRGEFCQTIKLPFVPFLELELYLGKEDDDASCDVIKSVAWIQKEQFFSCRLEDDHDKLASFKELYEYALSRGFEMEGDGHPMSQEEVEAYRQMADGAAKLKKAREIKPSPATS